MSIIIPPGRRRTDALLIRARTFRTPPGPPGGVLSFWERTRTMNPNDKSDEKPAQKHGALASPTPPPGAEADWTVPQRWEELTAEDHWVWDTLFARQQKLLNGRAVEDFQQGLDVLHLS